jgi:hypothetical protein
MRRSTRTLSSIFREIEESSSGSSDEESDNNSKVENVNELDLAPAVHNVVAAVKKMKKVKVWASMQ